MRLYAPTRDASQSFAGVKRYTVPQQNMSLREIIKRFIRKESLPVEQNGVYYEGLGDLEKLAKADIFDRTERAKDLKDKIQSATERMQKQVSPAKGGEPVEPPDKGQDPDPGAGK